MNSASALGDSLRWRRRERSRDDERWRERRRRRSRSRDRERERDRERWRRPRDLERDRERCVRAFLRDLERSGERFFSDFSATTFTAAGAGAEAAGGALVTAASEATARPSSLASSRRETMSRFEAMIRARECKAQRKPPSPACHEAKTSQQKTRNRGFEPPPNHTPTHTRTHMDSPPATDVGIVGDVATEFGLSDQPALRGRRACVGGGKATKELHVHGAALTHAMIRRRCAARLCGSDGHGAGALSLRGHGWGGTPRGARRCGAAARRTCVYRRDGVDVRVTRAWVVSSRLATRGGQARGRAAAQTAAHTSRWGRRGSTHAAPPQ